MSVSLRNVVARAEVGLLSGGFAGEGVLSCSAVRICWLAELHSPARRLICLSYELVRGARSLVGPFCVVGCAMGHVDCASSW